MFLFCYIKPDKIVFYEGQKDAIPSCGVLLYLLDIKDFMIILKIKFKTNERCRRILEI